MITFALSQTERVHSNKMTETNTITDTNTNTNMYKYQYEYEYKHKYKKHGILDSYLLPVFQTERVNGSTRRSRLAYSGIFRIRKVISSAHNGFCLMVMIPLKLYILPLAQLENKQVYLSPCNGEIESFRIQNQVIQFFMLAKLTDHFQSKGSGLNPENVTLVLEEASRWQISLSYLFCDK